MHRVKVILIHGNGGSTIDQHWFLYVKNAFEQQGVKVIAKTFPDNVLARSSHWLPFLEHDLRADECTVLIGHSSGAIAAMRYAEHHKILGSVLVGTYWTHLDMESEKASGYFDEPWNWDVMKKNQKWSIVFASSDDPWIPIEEARLVAEKLDSEYHEYDDRGHFMEHEFEELVAAVLRKVECIKSGEA